MYPLSSRAYLRASALFIPGVSKIDYDNTQNEYVKYVLIINFLQGWIGRNNIFWTCGAATVIMASKLKERAMDFSKEGATEGANGAVVPGDAAGTNERGNNGFLKGKKKMLLVGIAAAVVVIGGIVYEVVLPGVYGRAYLKDVQGATAGLHDGLGKIAESSTRPIFTNPDSTTGSDKNDIVILKDSLKEAEDKLKAFDDTIKTLKPLPLSGFFGSYRDAKGKQAKAESVSSEVQKRLEEYRELVAYIERQNEAGIKFEQELEALDKLETSEDLAEISQAFKDGAAALRTLAQEAGNNAPEAFQDLQDRLVAAVKEMAGVFDKMAVAINQLDADGISAAYDEIIAIAEKGKAIDEDFQARIGQDSKFIRNIKEMPTLTSVLN